MNDRSVRVGQMPAAPGCRAVGKDDGQGRPPISGLARC
jgi:hypothetical protein